MLRLCYSVVSVNIYGWAGWAGWADWNIIVLHHQHDLSAIPGNPTTSIVRITKDPFTWQVWAIGNPAQNGLLRVSRDNCMSCIYICICDMLKSA